MDSSLKKIFGELFNLHKDRASFEEIGERIYSGGTLKGTNMCILVLAIFIASIGLNMNSVAVIIGAMLISPLMGVIMSIGYGMATYDTDYVKESFLKLIFQVTLSVLTSALYFTLSPIDTASSELLARTEPTIWDVLIAVFGGLAGIIGSTRIEKGNVIPGVAIATALMPPLCTAGFGLASQSPKFFFGALYLFFINSVFICLTTFVILKWIDVPAKNYVSERAFKRQRWGLTILGIVVIIPSLFVAYRSVSDHLTQVQVKNYIDKNFNTRDSQAVAYRITPDKDELEITIVGKNITPEEQAELAKKINEYPRLSGLKLDIIQNDMTGTVRTEDLQNVINTKWADVGGANLEKTKEELKKYQERSLLYAPAYQRYTQDKKVLADIRAKAPLLFPQFAAIEAASVASEDAKGNVVYKHMLAVVSLKIPMSQEEITRFQRWINAETGMNVTIMYQNM
ncbi:MAG: DUF389 domain-containing protein [Selenomonadaceae bacterium]|nr:DUF389 domain-containing protein [Selenomonadaceae bacterium]